jgi:polysaccharide biosynthesis/export protein
MNGAARDAPRLRQMFNTQTSRKNPALYLGNLFEVRGSMRNFSFQLQPRMIRSNLHGSNLRRVLAITLPAVALLCLVSLNALAQNSTNNNETVYGSREPSQAQKEADRLATLAPERIITILGSEPGLLLQVKKRLVKMAFEQGRILDEQDLTDEALYRLIRQDVNIRAIATREIEDRNYIRPKPTRAELDYERRLREYREAQNAQNGTTTPTPPATPQQRLAKSQEEDYWLKHPQEEQGTPRRPVSPQTGVPRDAVPEPEPEPSDRMRRGREVYRADLEDNPFEMMVPDTSRMAIARPEDLSEMAAMAGARGARYGDDDDPFGSSSSGRGSTSRPSMPMSGAGGGSMPDTYAREYGRPRTSDRGRDTYSDRDRRYAGDYRDYRNYPRYPQQPVKPEPPTMQHTPNPYSNVPSLYDLYAQVSRRQTKLERFGVDIFTNGTGNFDILPMDMPVGPDYVLGPGDGVNIELWGSVSQRLQRVVDREGRLALPEAGTVLVAGRSLGDVQHQVQSVLRSQFRDVQADISLSRLRTVRIYVVGDVQNPGAYDISALSTPLNAIYEAGGPTARGSLRHIEHVRGKQVVGEYDAYDLILRGVRGDIKPLQPGDAIRVLPLGPQVTVEGGVRRPAIYELRGEQNLAEVLELAGGVMSTGTVRQIVVDRLIAHEKREMLNLEIPESNNEADANKKLADFKVQDGDKIRIALIPVYSEKTVYLDGHVFHPGKYSWKEGMKVSDALKTYSDLLPEPYLRHAEIIRLNPPNFTPSVISINLGDALAHKEQDIALQPFDTLRVFGRFDFEDTPVITVVGEVREPGDHRTNGATHVSDAVFLAGGFTSDAALDEVQVFRKSGDSKLKVISVNLRKALDGDTVENVLLEPKDRVVVHRDLNKFDPATVIVQGEVGKPGKYPLGAGMTATDLVRAAGGLKRSADTEAADLARYMVTGGRKVEGDHQTVEIAKALSGDTGADVTLKDGDVLSIRQLTGWRDRGASITLRGEVVHPGTYGIRDGERLSSILKRAGGLRSSAYTYGSVLQRTQVRDIEEQSRVDLLRRVEKTGDVIQQMPGQNELSKNAAIAQWEVTLEKLRTTAPTGRMVVRIPADVRHWEDSASDIEARDGDILTIPKKPNFVMIIGQVYNPTAVSYRGGKTAEWYLQQAGGPSGLANKHAIFVIRADGSVAGSGAMGGLFSGHLGGVVLRPGDTVVVPEKPVGGPSPWPTIFAGVQAFSSIAVAASVLLSQGLL